MKKEWRLRLSHSSAVGYYIAQKIQGVDRGPFPGKCLRPLNARLDKLHSQGLVPETS